MHKAALRSHTLSLSNPRFFSMIYVPLPLVENNHLACSLAPSCPPSLGPITTEIIAGYQNFRPIWLAVPARITRSLPRPDSKKTDAHWQRLPPRYKHHRWICRTNRDLLCVRCMLLYTLLEI